MSTETNAKIDVSTHHNAEGKLYMPSYPYGIKLFADMPGDNHREIGSDSAKTLDEAKLKALAWCDEDRKRSVVFRRRDGFIYERFGAWK